MSRRSRRSGLSREELEVQEAVFGTDSDSDCSPAFDPGQGLAQSAEDDSTTVALLKRQVSLMSKELADLKAGREPVSSYSMLYI